MARTKGRVALSRNARVMLLLAQKMYDKHQDLGSTSPLNTIDEPDINEVFGSVAEVLAIHDQAEQLARESEKLYRDRDARMQPINRLLKQSIQLLKAVYANNPKRLSDWGINIDDSQPAKSGKSGESA